MRNLTINLIGAIVLSGLIACIALGGGYQLNEQGARAVGMGGAFVAQASDPSAIYFNPAGLAFQNGINVLGGASLIMPSNTFKGLNPIRSTEVSTVAKVFTPITLYGTYKINDDIVVGLGIYNPFGLGTEWPDLWGFNNYADIYQGSAYAVKTNIQTWYFNPSVGYKINDQLSVGLGMSYVYGSVSMSRGIPFSSTLNGTMNLDGTGNGFNINFGAIYKPIEGLSVGLSYRFKTNIDFSGDVKFTDIPTAYKTIFPGGTGKATLPMPGNLYIGAAYELTPELTIEGDLQFVQWSAYKELKIEITPVTIMQGTNIAVKNWDDTYLLHGGLEYKCDADLTLRGGLVLDLTPQPPSKVEPMLPDADRIDITCGVGYKVNEKISVDLSYMLVLFADRISYYTAPVKLHTDMTGTYKSTAHLFGVDVSYAF